LVRRFSENAGRIPYCFTRQRCKMRRLLVSVDSTTLGSREDAPPGSLSMTTLPGAPGHTSCVLGTNTRILRLNDYDFGEGTGSNCLTYPPCRNIFLESHPRRQRLCTSANEPFNFLNLDLYAQDTWKVTKKLTWTFGIPRHS